MKRNLCLSVLIALFAFFGCNKAGKKVDEGKLKLSSGDYANAISLFNEALKIDNKNADAYYYLGICKINILDYAGAEKDLTTAIELKKELIDGFYQRAIAKTMQCHYNSALEDINTAISLQKDSLKYILHRGIVFAYLGKYKDAIDDFSQIIIADPKNIEAYLYRAGVYDKNLDNNNTFADCDRIISLDPENHHAYIIRGFANSALNKMQESEKDFLNVILILDKKIKSKPKEAILLAIRGYVKFSMYINNSKVRYKNYSSESMDDFSKSIELDSNQYLAYYSRGIVKMFQDDYSGAIADFNKAACCNRHYMIENLDRYNAIQKMAICEYRRNNLDKAIEYFTKVIEGENDLKDLAYDFRGQCKIELKDKSGACSDFSKAGELGNEKAYKHFKECGCK